MSQVILKTTTCSHCDSLSSRFSTTDIVYACHSVTKPRPIKVLHIINDLSIGGTEIMLFKLLSIINRELFDPVVISLMDQGNLRKRFEALDIPVFTAGMKAPLPSPSSIWRFVHLVRKLKPNLIHGWMYHGSLAAQLASYVSARDVSFLWGIHNSINSTTKEKKITTAMIRLCAALSRFPSGIIYVSHSNQTQHASLGYFNKNSYIIPNGFDASLFAPSAETKLEIRRELGFSDNALLIGLIGRFHPVKGHENFLRAASLLLKDSPEIRFILCGSQVDWDNLALTEIIKKLNLAGQVSLLGEREDISCIITALDIVSSSSHSEAFPNVIGEAMSCGVPCAITDVGDVPWIVGASGRVVQPNNPQALANAWMELILLGAEYRRKLGQAARERIMQCFSLHHVGGQYESLYMNTVARGDEFNKLK